MGSKSKNIWPLFGKTRWQLIKTAVEARFNEPKIFGRGDIASWLETQRLADYPDDTVWLGLLSKIATGKSMNGLGYECYRPSVLQMAEHCGQATLDDVATLKNFPSKAIDRLRGMVRDLYPTRVYLYLTGSDSSVLVFRVGDPQHSYKATWDLKHKEVRVSRIIDLDIVKALYYTWKTVGPRALKARRRLYRWLAHLVGDVRYHTRSDIDSAVAVSQDCRKMIHADIVAVIQEDGGIKSYDAGTFQTNKILLADHSTTRRQECPDFRLRDAAQKKVKQILATARTAQILVVGSAIVGDELPSKKRCRVFITPVQFVPRIA